MCFMMGAAAGGMLPVTYALLAEMMPSRHRGWALVLVGGLGAVGGYFAASGFSALLQPIFGWRILWLLNLPTGLSLVLLGAFIPESAKFLLARGRMEEARRVMERFGSSARQTRPAEQIALERGPSVALTGRAFFGKLLALSLCSPVLRPDQLRPAAVAARRSRRQGLQHGGCRASCSPNPR